LRHLMGVRMVLVVALSDATSNLLSALLGAIVGGAASLAGAIVVSRWNRVSDARLRLYDELIPAAMSLTEQLDGNLLDEQLRDNLTGVLHAMRRASIVAGRPERRAADAIVRAWGLVVEAKSKGLYLLDTPEALDAWQGLPPSLEAMMELLERRLD
jgi:hypothetical protein